MIVTKEVLDIELVRGPIPSQSLQRENQHCSQPLEVKVAIQVEHRGVPVPDSDRLRYSSESSANHICNVTQRPVNEK